MENFKCPKLSALQANTHVRGAEYKPVYLDPTGVKVGNNSDALPLTDFIVRACNAHEGLVRALEEIVKNDPYKQSSAGIIARKALAAAKGGM
jgi:hypothetical protein